ncbi:TPA: hypothetical protein ACGIKW_002961 [Acinetobacter baumannii]|uniref:hypothetical protein n=1 Tax=Acinetobacter baumannii TaxID=470 RepID=UPI00338E3A79
MDIFAKLSDVSEDDLHPKFKFLRDEPYYSRAKSIVESWAKDFYDRDNKIIKEFQTTFHSAFWEFYLHSVFKKIGVSLNVDHNRPDFITDGTNKYYIEAVVSEIKDGGRPEIERTLDDQFSMLYPIENEIVFSEIIDEAIVRHSNSIDSKLKKYTGYSYFDKKKEKEKWIKGYKECDWVDTKKPYLIALSSYDQVNYGKEYIYSMMALLYGYYFSPETKTYSQKKSIKKPGTDADISLGMFYEEKMKDVSAIIFTNTLTLGKLSSLSKSLLDDFAYVINIRYDYNPPHFKVHEVSNNHPEDLLDGLYIFKNPNANVQFDSSQFREHHVLEVSLDDRGFAFEGRPPIVSRYCFPSILINESHKEIIKSIAASKYNNAVAYDILD